MRLGLMSALLLCACSAADSLAADDYMQENFPPMSCASDSGADTECGDSGASDGGGVCNGSEDCPAGYCAASFSGDIGPLVCSATCIDNLDDAKWCADAAACCDPQAICDRGYCIGPGTASTGTSEASTGDASTGDASTGDASTGDASTGDASTGSASTGDTGTTGAGR